MARTPATGSHQVRQHRQQPIPGADGPFNFLVGFGEIAECTMRKNEATPR